MNLKKTTLVVIIVLVINLILNVIGIITDPYQFEIVFAFYGISMFVYISYISTILALLLFFIVLYKNQRK